MQAKMPRCGRSPTAFDFRAPAIARIVPFESPLLYRLDGSHGVRTAIDGSKVLVYAIRVQSQRGF
jgi:hypothetical protein